MTRSVPVLDLADLGRQRWQRVRDFMQRHVFISDGPRIGQPLTLLPAQSDFLRGVYGRLRPDGRRVVRRAIHSCGRKNGKSAFTSGLLQAHIFGPEAKQNSQVYSAARSLDQAALIFRYAVQSIRMNPRLEGLVTISDTRKFIRGTLTGATFQAISAEAKTAHGKNPAVVVHDELGQVVGPIDRFFEALDTATGAQDEPLSIIISTQAATDADLLSVLIDDALSSGDETTFIQLFSVPRDADIYDEHEWIKANYALGEYRSLEEMRVRAASAKRMPAFEAAFRNLYLNQRVSAVNNLFPPDLWRANAAEADPELFRTYPVHMGLDLSARTDLTAAVLAVFDPVSGRVGLRTYVFTPADGLEERAKRDRAPYGLWVQQGHLVTTPGRVVDYEWMLQYLARETDGMELAAIHYDRWRIDYLKKEAEKIGFADGAEWCPVGQGYRDISPRVETLETLALDARLMHGGHPVLTFAAMGAAVVMDPAGNRKLEKSKSSARIDAMIAALMAAHGCMAAEEESDYEIQFY